MGGMIIGDPDIGIRRIYGIEFDLLDARSGLIREVNKWSMQVWIVFCNEGTEGSKGIQSCKNAFFWQ